MTPVDSPPASSPVSLAGGNCPPDGFTPPRALGTFPGLGPLWSSLVRHQEAGAWRRPLLLLGAGVVGMEAISRFTPLDPGSLMGLGVLAGGWWVLSRRPAQLQPRLPETVTGWFSRCEHLVAQLERLEGDASGGVTATRRPLLERCRELCHQRALHLALVGGRPPAAAWQTAFAEALRGPRGISLRWGLPLPACNSHWQWPADFERCDVFLYHLAPPLRAQDLRWLEALPEGMPVWLLIELETDADQERIGAEVLSQWPGAERSRILFWDGTAEGLTAGLAPLTLWLGRQTGEALRTATLLRCLKDLHRRWQADLETWRRREWSQLQQRTQWIVAAGVFAAPLPTLDLLVLAVANGLMLREMARLWECSWTMEQLRAAAAELARATLAMGIVEWSSQALAAAVKLHGATWVVGGAIQAFSAAYLTRVVGRAMADVLALSAGVASPDLELIKRQAPLLVARAAEEEKVDWGGFIRQGVAWLGQRRDPPSPALQAT